MPRKLLRISRPVTKWAEETHLSIPDTQMTMNINRTPTSTIKGGIKYSLFSKKSRTAIKDYKKSGMNF